MLNKVIVMQLVLGQVSYLSNHIFGEIIVLEKHILDQMILGKEFVWTKNCFR